MRLFCFWVAALFWTNDLTAHEIVPPNVYALAMQAREEILLIHLEMGRKPPVLLQYKIDGALPREVFFQATTFFEKSDRLCFQFSGDLGLKPSLPSPHLGIQPRDVLRVVSEALEKITCAKRFLGIGEKTRRKAIEDQRTPSDVYRALLDNNRLLNAIADSPYLPTTVFRRMGDAIGRAKQLHRFHFPGRDLPIEPPFERRKTPIDVYRELLKAYGVFRTSAIRHGCAAVQFNVDKIDDVQPSDVYDLASLVISELDFCLQKNRQKVIQVKHPYAGIKLPSHVFQRAAHLSRIFGSLASPEAR